MIKIQILTGSTRPGRFNTQPANWLYELAKKRGDMEVELVDLAEVNLPFLDESTPPSQANYQNEHTKEWAARTGSADGYVFVTPEYNHSYSAVLKNAIDYLYAEWNFKPVGLVSYGSAAGGARAGEHLRGVAGELKMYDIREQVVLSNYWENLDEQGQYKFNERHEGGATALLDSLAFWASEMQASRAKLQAKP